MKSKTWRSTSSRTIARIATVSSVEPKVTWQPNAARKVTARMTRKQKTKKMRKSHVIIVRSRDIENWTAGSGRRTTKRSPRKSKRLQMTADSSSNGSDEEEFGLEAIYEPEENHQDFHLAGGLRGRLPHTRRH